MSRPSRPKKPDSELLISTQFTLTLDPAEPIEVVVDGLRILVSHGKEIELNIGESSATIQPDGTVTVRSRSITFGVDQADDPPEAN